MAEKAPTDSTVGLASQLDDYAIPVQLWGEGGAKTIEDLRRELGAGESSLIVTEHGELRRQIRALAINVYYPQGNGSWLRLVEASQQFEDGRRRVRRHNTSLGEKLVENEAADETALFRVINEELGVDDKGVAAWEHVKDVHQLRESDSFPGLTTDYLLHHYWVELNDEGYNPEGYVESQTDKTTLFVWVFADEDGKILLK